MGITGKLETMELAELLQWLSQARKTGTLVVRNESLEKRIFFREGRIISSASSDPREYLGAFLVAHGFIAEFELTQAIKMQESSKMLLGKILVTLGALREEDLDRMLRLKSEESIYSLFAWTSGDFRFLDNELPRHEMVAISLDVTGVVLEGIQRLDEWKRFRSVIPSLECVPVSLASFDAAAAEPGGQRVLALVDDDRSIAEICAALPAPEYFVCRHLFRQIEAGRLKVVRIRPRTDEQPPTAAGSIDAASLLALATRHFTSGQLEPALRHLRAATCLAPDDHAVAGEAEKLVAKLESEITKAGIRPAAVPVLTRPLEQLTGVSLSPPEGFLLTRLDGRTTVASLAKLSPLPALETSLLLWKLARNGHVRLQAAP